MDMVRSHHTYRDSYPTTSILTITSNLYMVKQQVILRRWKKSWSTIWLPGANPMHGKRFSWCYLLHYLQLLKLPFKDAQDGISNTFTVIPGALGKDDQVFAGDLDIDSIKEGNLD